MTTGFDLQKRSLLAAGYAALVLGSAAGSGAIAQEQKATGTLGEIIVTTTKREETLQDVPISVGVVTGKAVQEFGMQGFEEIQNHVPNLVIQETLGSYQIRIRGLGSGASQLSFVSAVGTFVDGVYCGRPRCFQNPLFDIERIEVVRGSQGALFGKNTIAGAVSTISAGPTEELEAEFSTGVELAEGGYNVSGIVSGPISDTLSFRVAAKYEDLDGSIKNTSTGKDENAVEATLVRGILDWDPTEDLHLRFKAEVAERDYDGYTTQLLALGGYGTPRPFSMPEAFDDKTSNNVIFPDGQFDNTDSVNYALQVDWDLAGGYTLTSITGAVSFDFIRRTTAVGYQELFVDTQIQEEYEQYSQELRLLSPTGGFFDYVLGLYYSEDDSTIGQSSAFVVPPFVPDVPGSGGTNDPNTKLYTTGMRAYHGEGDTLSAYASGTFHFFDDRARAILGLRVGEDTLDGNSFLVNATYNRATNRWTRIPDYTYIPIGASNREFDISSYREESYTLPSLTLQYDLTEDVNLYASYAEGFKGGGFIANDGTTGQNVQAQALANPAWGLEYAGMATISDVQLHDGITLKENNGIYDYKPEKADSYEIGAKMKFLNGAVNWNVALFRTEFENLQTSQYDGVRFITRNAAEATTQGVETDVQWLVNDYLTLGLNAAYNDAEYDTYKNTFCKVIDIQGTLDVPGCVNGQGDLSGERIERAPEYSGSFNIDWESPLTAGTLLRVNGAMTYSDDYFIQANMSPLYEQDSFTKYDLRVAVADADDNWEVALIGRNLSDELTLQHAFQVSVFHAASVSTPRYVTLQGTMKFR
ncbi:MAG: TonB-dependent receptor [Gammaproteobacteria bacterium]|nr:TonB-dependent receptor [Gammaproteobacteria bacterium]